MSRTIEFETAIPADFHWLYPPTRWQAADGLVLTTDPGTDFWQRTHYGFRNDNGHALLTELGGDFYLETEVSFRYTTQYDQCGLLVRLDAENWIKMSIEYENPQLCMLGSVVTNLGYSDWATTELETLPDRMWYRINRRGPDFLLEAAPDGRSWRQLRVTHLLAPFQAIQAGIYACSPKEGSFTCTFHTLSIGDSRWEV